MHVEMPIKKTKKTHDLFDHFDHMTFLIHNIYLYVFTPNRQLHYEKRKMTD